MVATLKQFLGEGPYPFPLELIENSIQIHQSTGLVVFLTKVDLEMSNELGKHAHSSYEFLIPYNTILPVWAEKKKFYADKNRLIPFNHDQAHGPADKIRGCRFMALQIEKNLVQDISRSIYGKNDVFFENDNYNFDIDTQHLIRTFMDEVYHRQPGYEFILDSLTTQLIVNILRRIKTNMPVSITERNYNERDRINTVISFLNEHYNSDYSLADVAQLANLSPYHFIKVFKAQTGKTPYSFLLDIKIEKARRMLEVKGYSVTEICYKCGFNNLSHFTTIFKKKVGVSPAQYRKTIHNQY